MDLHCRESVCSDAAQLMLLIMQGAIRVFVHNERRVH